MIVEYPHYKGFVEIRGSSVLIVVNKELIVIIGGVHEVVVFLDLQGVTVYLGVYVKTNGRPYYYNK